MDDEQREETERRAREDAEHAPPATEEQRDTLRLIFLATPGARAEERE